MSVGAGQGCEHGADTGPGAVRARVRLARLGARPQAHPEALLASTLTAPHPTAPRSLQAPAPPGGRPHRPTPWCPLLLPSTPLPTPWGRPCPPHRTQSQVSRRRSHFILSRRGPHSQAAELGPARPGRPSATGGPRPLPSPPNVRPTRGTLASSRRPAGWDSELVGRQGGARATEGVEPCPGRPSPSRAGPRRGSHRPGAPAPNPAGDRGPQGPARRRAGPRLSRSPPARAQGLLPGPATPLHRSSSQQSTSTFKTPELMKPIR